MCVHTHIRRQSGEVRKHPVKTKINMEIRKIVETDVIAFINYLQH